MPSDRPVIVFWGEQCSIPQDNSWLGPTERATLASFSSPKRIAEFRAGRWYAHQAIEALHPMHPFEVIAAQDGAPEVWRDNARLPIQVSISHRRELAAAAACRGHAPIGLDIEKLEERSSAFRKKWFTEAEQRIISSDPRFYANLLWSAKEAVLKQLRVGLSADPMCFEVSLPAHNSHTAPSGDGALQLPRQPCPALECSPLEWSPLQVRNTKNQVVHHARWALISDAYVLTLVGGPSEHKPY